MSQIGARTTSGIIRIAVGSGGSGYTAPPAVVFSGGGGTGATAYAHLSGGAVESVVIGAGGTGYTAPPTISFTGSGGTGAAATAYVQSGGLRPLSFFKGRFNDMYGVDGMGRGFRWNGTDASVEPIGLNKPAIGPAVTAASTSVDGYVAAVQMVAGGAGYHSPPTVSFVGGLSAATTGGTVYGTTAAGRAIISNGRVTGVTITERGSGYISTPTVVFSGGIGSSASFGVQVVGSASAARVTAFGSGYTSNATTSPSVQFSTAQGLTGAVATVTVDEAGRVSDVRITSAGTGATTTGVTAAIVGGGGTGASVAVDMSYSVTGLTIASSGSGYYTAPVITIRPAVGDAFGRGAGVTAQVNSSGNVTGATVFAGGQYLLPPTALILDTTAKAQATVSQNMRGVYKCAVRYLDDTPESLAGPIPSSISELIEIDTANAASSLTWTLAHHGLDARVSAVELWRTTADQSVILFRVATIQRYASNGDPNAAFSGAYTDTFSDKDLADTTRDGYAMMPVTLPNGQINARRFGVPPGNYAVATMFQDRAWYAVDVTGEKPNTLLYSEIDEPESVPEENELIVQENTGEPDKIVGLLPLGGQLLIGQQSHLYALNYVAQPIIDASVLLVAYRGVLNSRCWDVIGGVALIADTSGLYGFDGQNEDALSVPVDNYWRDGIIDFSKSDQFHVRAEQATKTVRFYYCRSEDSAPIRALCYCVSTKAWWEETYAVPITATCTSRIGGRVVPLMGTAAGEFVKTSGTSDSGAPIPYRIRTGNAALVNEGSSRSIAMIYDPTSSDSTISVGLHFNNSDTPRPNAISTDRGDGFSTTTGSTGASLNLNRNRSALGAANGFAQAYYSGRVDDRSAGGDRHLAVDVSGTQSADPITLYSIRVTGAT